MNSEIYQNSLKKKCKRCPNIAEYGYLRNVTIKVTHCELHKKEGMLKSLVSRKCEKCDMLPSYGLPGYKPSRCSKHKEFGMIYKTHSCRDADGNICYNLPTHRYFPQDKKRLRRCDEHKLPGMQRIDPQHRRKAYDESQINTENISLDIDLELNSLLNDYFKEII